VIREALVAPLVVFAIALVLLRFEPYWWPWRSEAAHAVRGSRWARG